MDFSQDALAGLRNEVAQLRRQNRRLAMVCGAALLVPLLLLLAGAQSTPGIQSAREFRLVDGSGQTRGALAMLNNTPALELFDSRNVARSIMSLDPAGNPWLGMFDARNVPRTIVALDSNGSPSVELYDAKKVRRTDFSLDPDGRPFLRLFDTRSVARSVLALDGVGSPGLQMIDAHNIARSTIAMDDDGRPFVRLSDPQDHTRAVLDAGGSLEVIDGAGYSAVLGVSATVSGANGSQGTTSAASLMLFNKDKHLTWQTPR